MPKPFMPVEMEDITNYWEKLSIIEPDPNKASQAMMLASAIILVAKEIHLLRESLESEARKTRANPWV